MPDGDPFTALTDIDATLGTQSPYWGFDGVGVPLPMPGPAVRGRGAFVAIFEFTLLVPLDATENFPIDIGGNMLAASSWEVVGTPAPPDPETMTPGMVTYAPVPTEPAAFSRRLLVIVPGPGAVSCVTLALFRCGRRRRPSSVEGPTT